MLFITTQKNLRTYVFTRFNLQEIPLNKSLLDADFFLEQLTEEIYPMLRDKNLKFDINLPPNMKIYVGA
ncbi:hypothetical protein [Clostridium coskatii]|uniref:hypothetical protein n=1 Tax=Clostridium coskatii TaxID=1705578 RepID=UPI000A6E4F81|nr:hypothetical protein [Clostridium coskatii]